MRNVLHSILLFLILPCVVSSQSNPPEKLRYTTGFLSGQYELGDKDVTQKQVLLHLKEHSTEGYYFFKKSINQGYIAVGAEVIGAAFLLGGLFINTDTDAGLKKSTNLYLAALGSFGVGLGFSLSSLSNNKKAINAYNVEYGYR